MDKGSLFSDFLTQLGVRHTTDYSDKAFGSMPFKSLYGLTKLLDSYGVENEALRLADTGEIVKLPVPFLASTAGGFVIVTEVGDGGISYITQGEPERMALDEFVKAWSGVVLLAYPGPDSCEPDYGAHSRDRFIAVAKKWVLILGAIALSSTLSSVTGFTARGRLSALPSSTSSGCGSPICSSRSQSRLRTPQPTRSAESFRPAAATACLR